MNFKKELICLMFSTIEFYGTEPLIKKFKVAAGNKLTLLQVLILDGIISLG